uniref:Uncharacterized protein n=1 Tax=Arundo donax TaxID=35708 RepID=A0A0A8YWJ3_ARUDO
MPLAKPSPIALMST